MKSRLAFALSLLLLASLACSALDNFANIPGPEDTATDAFGSPVPTSNQIQDETIVPATPAANSTRTPAPNLTQGAAVTPAGATAAVPPTRSAAPTPISGPTSLTYTLDSPIDLHLVMLPPYAADAQNQLDASRYVIDVGVTFDGARSATLSGHELIRYTNRQTITLDSLVLMLWPNDSDQYLGQLTLGAVTVDGAPVQPAFESRGLAARLPLAAALAPGQRVDLAVDFTTQANAGAEQGARFGLTHGVLIAPTFYPIIPRIVNGQWQSEWPASAGDVSNSDTAFYAYRVTAPPELAIAASGVVVEEAKTDGFHGQTLLTGPMRDIALVVGDLTLNQSLAPDGVTVNAWVLPEHTAQGGQLNEQASNQLQNLDSEVGPYPFRELDVVDTPGAYGGVEYPGLVFIGVVDTSGGFEEATVHEVGHQWFYSLIGDDQLLQPWLDEAAASYTELLYAEKFGGAQAAQNYRAFFQGEANSASDPSQPIGLPVDQYSGLNDYAAIVYGKGALFFDALRQQLGDAVFFQFLHAYYQQYRYGFADSAGFERVAEATCSCDLKPLFEKWVFGKQ